MGEVSRAVVAESGAIPWEISLKTSLDLQRGKKGRKLSNSSRNKSPVDTVRMQHPQCKFLFLNLRLVPV